MIWGGSIKADKACFPVCLASIELSRKARGREIETETEERLSCKSVKTLSAFPPPPLRKEMSHCVLYQLRGERGRGRDEDQICEVKTNTCCLTSLHFCWSPAKAIWDGWGSQTHAQSDWTPSVMILQNKTLLWAWRESTMGSVSRGG